MDQAAAATHNCNVAHHQHLIFSCLLQLTKSMLEYINRNYHKPNLVRCRICLVMCELSNGDTVDNLDKLLNDISKALQINILKNTAGITH